MSSSAISQHQVNTPGQLQHIHPDLSTQPGSLWVSVGLLLTGLLFPDEVEVKAEEEMLLV